MRVKRTKNEIKLYLPWKTLGWDGRKHQVTLTISWGHTQQEEQWAFAEKLMAERKRQEEERKNNRKEKLERGGIRYCKGHKKPNAFTDDKCNLCGGKQPSR